MRRIPAVRLQGRPLRTGHVHPGPPILLRQAFGGQAERRPTSIAEIPAKFALTPEVLPLTSHSFHASYWQLMALVAPRVPALRSRRVVARTCRLTEESEAAMCGCM